MKEKILSILTAVAMVFTMSGCSSKAQEKSMNVSKNDMYDMFINEVMGDEEYIDEELSNEFIQEYGLENIKENDKKLLAFFINNVFNKKAHTIKDKSDNITFNLDEPLDLGNIEIESLVFDKDKPGFLIFDGNSQALVITPYNDELCFAYMTDITKYYKYNLIWYGIDTKQMQLMNCSQALGIPLIDNWLTTSSSEIYKIVVDNETIIKEFINAYNNNATLEELVENFDKIKNGEYLELKEEFENEDIETKDKESTDEGIKEEIDEEQIEDYQINKEEIGEQFCFEDSLEYERIYCKEKLNDLILKDLNTLNNENYDINKYNDIIQNIENEYGKSCNEYVKNFIKYCLENNIELDENGNFVTYTDVLTDSITITNSPMGFAYSKYADGKHYDKFFSEFENSFELWDYNQDTAFILRFYVADPIISKSNLVLEYGPDDDMQKRELTINTKDAYDKIIEFIYNANLETTLDDTIAVIDSIEFTKQNTLKR